MNVFIEGDKNAFSSKSAIIKFKDYVKKNIIFNIEDLQNKYINYNYKLELIEKTDEKIIFNTTIKEIINKVNNKKIIKNKINDMKLSRIKSDDSDIFNLYNKLKKLNSNIPLPSPDDIKKEPEKYKPIVSAITTTLNKKLGSNNNYIKYFKLLNAELEHIEVPEPEPTITNEITEIITNIKGNDIVDADTDTEEENNDIVSTILNNSDKVDSINLEEYIITD